MATMPSEAIQPVLGPRQPPAAIQYFGFAGLIDPTSATRIAAAFNTAVNQGAGGIYLCLSSPGGLVGDGIYLYNHIRALPIPVTVHNIGTVASIAVAIYCAAGARLCSGHGIFLIHPTTVNNPGNRTAEELKTGVTSALADDKRTENILRERTSMPNQLLRKRRVGDVWITPSVALKHSLVHRIEEFVLPPGQHIYQI
jgi:ATP-dependent protease ClpP protease subunit